MESRFGNRFKAKIMRNYKRHDLGIFDTPSEASAAPLAAKSRLHDQP
jgi:hypothetical protein